jgi:hypothetical protein
MKCADRQVPDKGCGLLKLLGGTRAGYGQPQWELEMRLSLCLVGVVLTCFPLIASAQSGSTGTRRKSAPVHVDLPPGWQAKKPPLKAVIQFAEYPDLTAYFELIVEPKSDFADNIDLMAWAKLVKENSAKKSTLANRKDTELQERKVGNRTTVEYEILGELRGVKLHYRNIMLQSGNYYCKLVCWTTPSNWEDAQPQFDALVGRTK